MAAELSTSTEGATLILTIRPAGRGSAFGPDLCAAGVEALASAGSNPALRHIVLSGERDAFDAGGDDDPFTTPETIENLHNWIEAIHTCPRWVTAALEGAAAGPGAALALACDFVVAASNATLAATDGNAIPIGGLSWELVHALPRQLATELLTYPKALPAQRLLELGIVNRICEPGAALASALAWCQGMNPNPARHAAALKELLHGAVQVPLATQLDRERDNRLTVRAGFGRAGSA